MSQSKISPVLRSLVTEATTENIEISPRFESLSVVTKPNNEKFVVVFVHCNEQANFDHLVAHRIKVNQKIGKIRTAYLPVSALDKLAEEATVSFVNHTSKMQTKMDNAREVINYDRFLDNAGLTGKDVIIGVVDTGIDSKHPAFANRIIKVWDQKLPGSGPTEGPSYGMELNPQLMEVSRDEEGHGTHVAGIAAAKDGQWSGIAPEANLIVVKTDFDNAHIADAVSYIFREAEKLGKPAVVNLSLGGHADAHDGSDELSQIIDSEVGKGKIVCCAAGNEGMKNIHAQITLQPARIQEIELEVMGLSPYFYLNGWYSAQTKVEIAMVSPDNVATPFQAVASMGGQAVHRFSIQNSVIELTTPPATNSINQEHNFSIFGQTTTGQPLTRGIWRLLIKTNPNAPAVVLHTWIIAPNEPVMQFRGMTATSTHKIGSPGAAQGAITVASYATRNELPSGSFNFLVNQISDFSSPGPLRNGNQKPDVAAPGQMIISALSSNHNFAGREFLVVDTKHIAMQGTSMATPVVTGIVALLLQHNPTLNPDDIKELLKKNSKIPNVERGTYDKAWGFGLIDMQELLAKQLKEADLAGFLRFQDMDDIPVQEGVWRASVSPNRRRKKLKGFALNLLPNISGLDVEYMAHLEGTGDTAWVRGGTYLGFPTEKNRRIEGFAIRLTGALANNYEVVYVARPQGLPEPQIGKNGQFCGTRGESRSIEALKVQINLKS